MTKRRRSSSRKREREYQKRQRELKKAQKAATKRERRTKRGDLPAAPPDAGRDGEIPPDPLTE